MKSPKLVCDGLCYRIAQLFYGIGDNSLDETGQRWFDSDDFFPMFSFGGGLESFVSSFFNGLVFGFGFDRG